MKHETGSPAFDNVDELLVDRIAAHGRAHSDAASRVASVGESEDSRQREDGTLSDRKSATCCGAVFGVKRFVSVATLILIAAAVVRYVSGRIRAKRAGKRK